MSSLSNIFSSETTEPIEVRFYMEHLCLSINQSNRVHLFKANDVVNDSLKFTSSDTQIC